MQEHMLGVVFAFATVLLLALIIAAVAITHYSKSKTESGETVNLKKSKYATVYTRSFSIPKTFGTSQARDAIDAAVYINLAEREDRRLHIEEELSKVTNVCKVIERLDAVKHEFGPKGCAMSQIKALKRAKTQGWKNVMIVEDDLQFRDDNAALLIAYAIRSHEFDVLMISGNIVKKKRIQTPGLSKALEVRTASCYVVDVFTESENNLSQKTKFQPAHQ